MKLSKITSKDLKTGKLKNEFPEFYNLKDVVELSPWHDHQDVFDHVVLVYENLEKILQDDSIQAKLAEKIATHSRLELLKIATLLHDIAKRETLVLKPDGTTSCPNHEELGAERVKNYIDIFGLSSIEVKHIEQIVRYHGFIFEIISKILENPKQKMSYWSTFEETVGNVAFDIVVLMTADLKGSDLQKSSPEYFNSLLTILNEKLPH